jgi:hypothetical protein
MLCFQSEFIPDRKKKDSWATGFVFQLQLYSLLQKDYKIKEAWVEHAERVISDEWLK